MWKYAYFPQMKKTKKIHQFLGKAFLFLFVGLHLVHLPF